MAQSLVRWREWNDETFAEAKEQNKPILLGISAVWCHWCHVMDRGVDGDPVHTGVYNNAPIADFINVNFIPVRVDNDQRPDINARYNMGGWPTTCFLTPDGEVIYGATYLAPSQMRNLLPQIAEVWQNRRDELLQKMTTGDARTITEANSSPDTLRSSYLDTKEIVGNITHAITRNYDPKHGGLGEGQKFPMSDAWSLLLSAYAETKEPRLFDMVATTLVNMGTRGMYDLVEGGWFRYSTTPDWSVPHFEKMLEDYARLLPVYLNAILLETNDARKTTLTKIVQSSFDYLAKTLLFDKDGVTYFAGSQDADETYYMLSRDERRAMQAPFIDWRLYADWNALMVSALLHASVVLDQPNYRDLAVRVWQTLRGLCIGDDGGVRHSLKLRDDAPNAQTLVGQLGDQAACAKAALDLAQHFGADAPLYLAQARKLIAFANQNLKADDGGYYDSPISAEPRGLLRVRIKPIFDNATMAEAMLALYYLTSDDRHWETDDESSRVVTRQSPIETLAIFNDEYKRYREHAAAYAAAVMKASNDPEEIVVVAHDAQADDFVRAAMKRYASWRVVRTLGPKRDADVIQSRGYPIQKLPVAFLCKGETCSAPIYTVKTLNERQ
jgi:hypothetical protein